MTDHITVSIDEHTGTTRFLVGELGQSLLTPDCIVRRASSVEPISLPLRLMFHLLRSVFGEDGHIADWARNWNCFWRINLSPVGGPGQLDDSGKIKANGRDGWIRTSDFVIPNHADFLFPTSRNSWWLPSESN